VNERFCISFDLTNFATKLYSGTLKLQGSVASRLRCGGILMILCRKFILKCVITESDFDRFSEIGQYLTET